MAWEITYGPTPRRVGDQYTVSVNKPFGYKANKAVLVADRDHPPTGETYSLPYVWDGLTEANTAEVWALGPTYQSGGSNRTVTLNKPGGGTDKPTVHDGFGSGDEEGGSFELFIGDYIYRGLITKVSRIRKGPIVGPRPGLKSKKKGAGKKKKK